jgi:hypothetical protein
MKTTIVRNVIVTILFILVASSCSSGGGNTAATSASHSLPSIVFFTASPTIIASGQSSRLDWSVNNASTIALNGNTVNSSSSTVSPVATTTCVLTAVNSFGTVTASVTVTVGSSSLTYGNLHSADLGAGANLNGAIPFPADNAWNRDISADDVDPNSNNLIASIGLTTGLHPDFGSGLYDGAPIGIPYVVVSGSQANVAVVFGDYEDESDPGPYPVPPTAPIEGQQADGSAFNGDRHVLVINRNNNRLYEMGNAYPQTGGSWEASGGAVFHLDSDTVRPTGEPGWTSADAAGLPIFPGLARYEAAANGVIRHALRFTIISSRRAYVPPATHWASGNTSVNLPPMGMRVRLKSSYVIPAGFSAETKVILQALKTYGMFVADNGSNWYVSGAPDPRWDNDSLVSELGSVKGSDFEVLRMDGLVTP